MTAFLVIAAITVPVTEGQAVVHVEPIGTSVRTFTGVRRSTVRAEKRVWQVTTGLMLDSAATALKAAIAFAAHVTCSGNMLGGSVICEVETGDDNYVNVNSSDGLGFMRSIALTLYEV